MMLSNTALGYSFMYSNSRDSLLPQYAFLPIFLILEGLPICINEPKFYISISSCLSPQPSQDIQLKMHSSLLECLFIHSFIHYCLIECLKTICKSVLRADVDVFIYIYIYTHTLRLFQLYCLSSTGKDPMKDDKTEQHPKGNPGRETTD